MGQGVGSYGRRCMHVTMDRGIWEWDAVGTSCNSYTIWQGVGLCGRGWGHMATCGCVKNR